MISFIPQAIRFVVDFVQERDGSSSSVRLCGILLCVTGCGCAAFTVAFAFHHPAESASIAALVGVTTALIGSGCVQMFLRTPAV